MVPDIFFFREHGHWTFTGAFYNCIIRGQRTIIQKVSINDEDEEEKSDVIFDLSKSRATAEMFSKFLNITGQFTELVDDTRKEQLMSRTTAYKSLPFHSPTPLDQSRKAIRCKSRPHR
jgi:hypothetical protein